MNSTEKEIYYSVNKSYSTLNSLSDSTKNVWFVCHGMGYLSKYFIRYFKDLNPAENYIIAPQAPSKYYLNDTYKHVGANWLTRDDTQAEMENIISYFDAILKEESIPEDRKLIVMGYSQGVSVAMRYIAKRKLTCSKLIMHSGGIPKELVTNDFKFFKGKAKLVYGTEDEFLSAERMDKELRIATTLFGEQLEVLPFSGRHEVNTEILQQFA